LHFGGGGDGGASDFGGDDDNSDDNDDDHDDVDTIIIICVFAVKYRTFRSHATQIHKRFTGLASVFLCDTLHQLPRDNVRGCAVEHRDAAVHGWSEGKDGPERVREGVW